MNFLFASCQFDKNTNLNQYNNTFIPQNRIPFADITLQMNSFFNSKKNQQNNILSKNFNDYSNDKENFTFLKKKSFGENINNDEKDEKNEEHNFAIDKPRRYSNKNLTMRNSLINNLDEDEDENNEPYFFNLENDKKGKKEENLSIIDILNDAIKEKKEIDKIERDRKKMNKLKQLKIQIKHKKHSLDYTNKNNFISNKENINTNTQINYLGGFQEQNMDKELTVMNID